MCPAGTIVTPFPIPPATSNFCLPIDGCHTTCSTCSANNSTTSCTACASGSNPQLYLTNTNECLDNCVGPYFKQLGPPPICAQCQATCKKCTGPLNSDCTECITSNAEKHLHLGRCLTECPIGYTPEAATEICI